MNKTFTDCYLAEGFRGGGWSYALNTNDTDGTVADTPAEIAEVGAEKRRLACYYLGWESIEVRKPSYPGALSQSFMPSTIVPPFFIFSLSSSYSCAPSTAYVCSSESEPGTTATSKQASRQSPEPFR
jgi:hypothetical protein